MINAGMVVLRSPTPGESTIRKGGWAASLSSSHVAWSAHGARSVTSPGLGGCSLEQGQAVGVRAAGGKLIRAKRVISNATRWDPFGSLVEPEQIPPREQLWRKRYKASPAFLSLHLGVDAGDPR